jgi:RNA polymerase sigma-70 factor, ECF subfamily
VIEANRAVAVAYAEGTAAGLAILDTLTSSSQLARWPQLHIARGGLLAQAGRAEDAIGAYGEALALEPSDAVRRFLSGEITALRALLLEGDEAGKANEIEDDYDDGVDAHP